MRSAAGEDEREPGNRSQTSHNKTGLLGGPRKPWQRARATVKVCLLKLRSVLGTPCGMEWYVYTVLGVTMATLSFIMDVSVSTVLTAHRWLYVQLQGHVVLQFFCWTLYPACICAVAASFSSNICPFSTGSGIPEVRTILSGIEMPNYLSVSNMLSKFVGLSCTLAAGSTVFLGKVGPFVHLSTVVGVYLNNLLDLIQDDKTAVAAGRLTVVAAAVGVASTFRAPVSGVLFSVEVMSSHFSLRHYCPCFLSAACGALTFSLFSVWSGDEAARFGTGMFGISSTSESPQALFTTHFPFTVPFYPREILLFALLGLLCGAVSCFFLFCHRWILKLTKTNRLLINLLTTEKGLYSGVAAFLLASITFPPAAGRHMASKLSTKQLLTTLLDNSQWSAHSHNASVPGDPVLEWSSSGSAVRSLLVFLLMKMWMLLVASTLPVPAGYFMPVFVYGAALGRLLGEGVAYVSSTGLTSDQQWASINPGGYALAGAAAFSGAVTHSLSPALLAVELTGEFGHAVPVLLATLLANGVARSGLRPSFYDALAISKRLPHLASLGRASPRILCSPLGRFLGEKSVQIEKTAGRVEVEQAVNTSTDTHIAVVDSHESQMILGFVLRSELLTFLHQSETLEKHLDEVCCIHPPSVLLTPHSTVQEVHGVLSTTEAQTLFVADGGRLVGHVTWTKMKRILEELAEEI